LEIERSPEISSDFWPQYHKPSGKLLGIGHTVVFLVYTRKGASNDHVVCNRAPLYILPDDKVL